MILDVRHAVRNLQHCVTFAEGRGKLIDKHTVEVELSAGGTKRMTGKTILLAMGGKPSKIDIPGSVSPSQ